MGLVEDVMSEYLNELIRQYLASNPQAAMFNMFPQAGGTSPFADFLRGSQGRLYGSFQGQLPQRPNLLYQDFLKDQDLPGQFGSLAPSQRGEQQGRFAPPVRWLPRRF